MIEIYNCDCRDLLKRQDIVEKKICIVTDPPFNVGYKYNSYKDNLPEKDYYKFLENVLTSNGVPFVVIHYPEQLYKLSLEINMFPEKVIAWVYNANTKKQHRDIGFFGVAPDLSKVKQPYKNPNDKRIKAQIAKGKTGTDIYDWWFINQVKNVSREKTAHPCQMPLEVMKNIIGILPDEYIILDPFMGSGTTGVACMELGRDFIGCEIDEDYFKIACERLGVNVATANNAKEWWHREPCYGM